MGTSRRDALRMGFMAAAGLTTFKIIGPAPVLPGALAADAPIAALAAGPPTDAFLRLDGIPGDSADADHPGEIVVGAYSFGVANAGSSGPGGGAGAGKATFTDLTLTLAASSASPLLMVACASGRHFPEAVLTVRRSSDGNRHEFFKVTLEEVLVSSYQHTATTAEGVTLETVGLRFATIEVEYTPQSPAGAAGPVSSGGWDLRTNQTTF